MNAACVRHEDVTYLSFPDEAFDVIGTFDVLEHVPDSQHFTAGEEYFRVRCIQPLCHLLAPLD
jgi:2-polyprenyl-3-methyl-5-hydroxy-6-metoxy-1,4-benzoquinol methylase